MFLQPRGNEMWRNILYSHVIQEEFLKVFLMTTRQERIHIIWYMYITATTWFVKKATK
jgi:hypothetical protein